MRSGSQVIDTSPPVAGGDGGGGGGWAWILTARGIIEAQLVRGVLEGAGVLPVALDARDPSPGAWMFISGNVNALVRVFVPASMLDAGRLALLESGFGFPEVPEPARATQPARATARATGRATEPSRALARSGLIGVIGAIAAIVIALLVIGSATCMLRVVC